MGVACGTYAGEEKCTPTLMEKTKGKRPLGRPTRRRKVALKYILNKQDVASQTALIWLRIAKSGGLL